MTDYLLGLIPDYGLYLIFTIIVLACLAVPMPASMLVLAAGSFAAAGDLVFWQVLTVACLAFIVGDQLAFHIARRAGPPLLNRLRKRRRMEALISRSEDLLQRRGGTAVLLSRTVISPTGPYVSYICGAGGMRHGTFSTYAAMGAGIWAIAYSGLGYVFADQLVQVSEVMVSFLGFVAAAAVAGLSLRWLFRQWRASGAAHAQTPVAPHGP